jgi:hypothetical protein
MPRIDWKSHSPSHLCGFRVHVWGSWLRRSQPFYFFSWCADSDTSFRRRIVGEYMLMEVSMHNALPTRVLAHIHYDTFFYLYTRSLLPVY